MNIPSELNYTNTHEWLSIDGEVGTVGLTDYAQDQLGDIVFINLPEVGDEVSAGEAFADVESVKAVSEVNSPVTGTVSEVNEELLDNPALINEAAYDAWLIRVSPATPGDGLLDAAAYEAICD